MRKLFLLSIFSTFIYSLDIDFQALDTFRNPQTNREISTKIVNKQFNIRLAAFKLNNTPTIFKGTVCAKVMTQSGISLSPWKSAHFNNESRKTISFKIGAASKNSVIKMMWKKDNYVSCDELEGNYDAWKFSSDHFAIRPYKFCLYANHEQISADKFFINFKALDFEHTNCKEASTILNYNESANDTFTITYQEKDEPICVRGIFKPSINQGWNFDNANKSLEVEYNEIGKVRINISDRSLPCNRRFASIDCKDKNIPAYWNNIQNTKIGDTEIAIHFLPKQFDVNATLKNFKDQNFTYLTKNISDMYALHDIHVSATNAKREVVKNYDKNCYAQDAIISLTYNKLIDNASNPLTDTPQAMVFKEINMGVNVSNTISPNEEKKVEKYLYKNMFSKGTISAKLRINFTKDKLLSPFNLSLKELTVEDMPTNPSEKIQTNDHSVIIDGNATFFYGRIKIPDMITMQEDLSNYAIYEIYDTTSSYPWIKNSINWYKNMWHKTNSQGHIQDIIPTMTNQTIDNTTSKLTINKPLAHVNMGGQNIKLSLENPENSEDFTLHVKIDPWLWYSNNAKTYNDADSSSCLQHPCFDVYYKKDTKKPENGEFSGSDVIVQEVNSSIKKGVKIFR